MKDKIAQIIMWLIIGWLAWTIFTGGLSFLADVSEAVSDAINSVSF